MLTDQKFVLDPQLLLICGFIVPILVEFATKHGVPSRIKQYTATGGVALAVAVSAAVAVGNGTFHIGSLGDVWNLVQVAVAQLLVARGATEAGVKVIQVPEAMAGTTLSQVLAPGVGIGPRQELGPPD